MASWNRKSHGEDSADAEGASSSPSSSMSIPLRQQHAPVDAVFTAPVPGHDDITLTVTATAGAAPDRGTPPILIARAEWDGVLDGEDLFGVALSVTLFNAANAAPRLQLYRDPKGYVRMAVDTVLAGFGGFTEAQISDWVPMAAGLGEHLAEIVGQTWLQAPRVPRTDDAVGDGMTGGAGELVEVSMLPGRLAEVVGVQAATQQAAPVTPERVAGLLFGPGAESRVQHDGDGRS